MTIEKIKEILIEHIGDIVTINYALGRNKYESYNVKIKNLYNHVFTVELNDCLKSFSYSDIITKTIKIDFN